MSCKLKEPVNTVGRPRLYDRLKIGRDFIEYARTHPDCLTVPCFASTIGIDSGMMRRWALECEEFRTSFNRGKELIGINRLNATNNKLMEKSLYTQVIGNFDIDINEYQRQEKAFESSLKREEAAQVDDKYSAKVDDMLNQIKSLQSDSALKAADISSKTE